MESQSGWRCWSYLYRLLYWMRLSSSSQESLQMTTPTSFEESAILVAVVRCRFAVETSQDSISFFWLVSGCLATDEASNFVSWVFRDKFQKNMTTSTKSENCDNDLTLHDLNMYKPIRKLATIFISPWQPAIFLCRTCVYLQTLTYFRRD